MAVLTTATLPAPNFQSNKQTYVFYFYVLYTLSLCSSVVSLICNIAKVKVKVWALAIAPLT